jgi:uncharacterized membrane protein YqaE (UPF0057 family)
VNAAHDLHNPMPVFDDSGQESMEVRSQFLVSALGFIYGMVMALYEAWCNG